MRGYKICYTSNGSGPLGGREFVLVELEIPEDATWFKPEFENYHYTFKQNQAGSYEPDLTVGNNGKIPHMPNLNEKCRADKATCVKIHGGFEEAFSLHDPAFTYTVGKELTPTEPFDPVSSWACSSGIHFFLTKEQALKYLDPMFYPSVIVDKEEEVTNAR